MKRPPPPAMPDEHGKHPHWQVPVKVEGAGKGAYNATMASGAGSQAADAGAQATREHGTSNPAGKALQTVSDGARKLARQSGNSG